MPKLNYSIEMILITSPFRHKARARRKPSASTGGRQTPARLRRPGGQVIDKYPRILPGKFEGAAAPSSSIRSGGVYAARSNFSEEKSHFSDEKLFLCGFCGRKPRASSKTGRGGRGGRACSPVHKAREPPVKTLRSDSGGDGQCG